MRCANSLCSANRSVISRSNVFSPKLGIAPRVNQLSIHPDAIAGPACRALKNMCYSQGQSDFTQIARAALELLYRGAADDLKVSDLGQVRENVIVYAAAKYSFSLSSLKFSNGRTAMLFSGILRIAAGRTGNAAKLLSLSSVRLIPCGVRSNIHDSVSAIGKPTPAAAQPGAPPNLEFRRTGKLRCDLNEQPGGDGVGDGNAVDLAALQFGKNDFTRSAPAFRHYKVSHPQQVKGCELMGLMKYERDGQVRWRRSATHVCLHRRSCILRKRGDWCQFIGNCFRGSQPWKFSRIVSSGPLCFFGLLLSWQERWREVIGSLRRRRSALFYLGRRYHGWPELAALHLGGQHRSRSRNQSRLFHDPDRKCPAWRSNFARATQRLADRFHSHCFGRCLYSYLWLRPFPMDRARALHQFRRPLRIAAEAVRHRCHSRAVFGNALSPAAWPLLYLVLLANRGALIFGPSHISLSAILTTSGIVTAVPLIWFGYAARHLRLVTIGFLQYLSPSISFILGLLFITRHSPASISLPFFSFGSRLSLFQPKRFLRWRAAKRLAAEAPPDSPLIEPGI